MTEREDLDRDELCRDDEYLLLSRVVDREDDVADWQSLDALAAADGAVYARLAHLLRDDSGLRAAVGFELSAVEQVVAPVHSRRPWWSGLTAASGWAAALLVAALWASGLGSVGSAELGEPGRDVASSTGLASSATLAPSDATARPALDAARAQPAFGRLVPSAQGVEVLGELSPELVSTRPAADGGIEVITVRRVLEREIVHDVYTVGSDELGRSVPIPVTSGSLLASDLY